MSIVERLIDWLNPQVEEDEPILHASEMYQIAVAANNKNRNEAKEWAQSEIKNIEKQMINKAREGGYSLTVDTRSQPIEYYRALTVLLEDKGYFVTSHFNDITIRWYKNQPTKSRTLECPPPPQPR